MARVKHSTSRKSSAATGRNPAAKDIDAYLAAVPEPARSTLAKVRAAIRAAAPDAVETISYGMPALKQGKVLLWFAAFSDHCSLFPTAAVIEEFRDELKGYTTTKGSIHFAVDKPMPAALVKKLVKARLAQVAGRRS